MILKNCESRKALIPEKWIKMSLELFLGNKIILDSSDTPSKGIEFGDKGMTFMEQC